MNSILEFIGHGGGKINSRLLYTILIIFSLSLALPLCLNTVSATTTTGNQTIHTNTTIKINNTNTSSNTPNKTLASGSPSTSSVSKTTFTLNQINNASARIDSFVNTNHRLPNYVTISNQDVTMPQFLQLVTQDLINTNSGSKTSVTLGSVNNGTNPSDNFQSGDILKSEYISIANKVLAFINSYGRAPNFATTSLGSISYESLIYDYSKIMNFYLTNKKLPNYVSVSPGVVKLTSPSNVPAALLPYLQPGTYAQSTNPTIDALSASITKGLTTPYAKAVAIFDWVRDNITYSFYYGTKYGAVGTLSSMTANCVDHSDLVVALARAAGIPARYQEGYCDFSDGWYDHVWAQLYVNGEWYYADTISTLNTFGVINNWNLKTYTLEGTFIQFP